MTSYTAPLRDMRFCYYEMNDGAAIANLPGFEDATEDLVLAILEEANKVASEILHPLNRSGDEEGCTLENGVVRTPKGFKEAYRAYCEGGWTSMTSDPEYGGQGLPNSVGVMVSEMTSAANQSFAMYPGLTHGAYAAIHTHGTDELKNTYLPKMVSGEWTGTMCLTEPQCGTDLGLVRTKAVPQDDGTYQITGTKIFISSGDHDLTDNNVHLVLARMPDSPKGIKGISLFIVPKNKVNEDGSIGSNNGVSCGAIEYKMGIKASATCVINFDDAQGHLIGVPNKGMQGMFVMMNGARLGVGVQGMAQAEGSYQGAVEYARDRLQGRALTGTKAADKPADPILVHPDVRKMLLTMRAYTEGSRMLTTWMAQELDFSLHCPDPERRMIADDLASLLTPIVKGFQTDIGFECVNLGVQIFGGHGYIREHGMEQRVRDTRIAQLYEGTNGIQALDLVGRKLPAHLGRYLRRFFHPVQEFIQENANDAALAEFVLPLAKSFGRLQQTTAWLAEEGMKNPDQAGTAATDYMRMFGLVTFAYLWTKAAKLSVAKLADENCEEREFYQAKVDTARFFVQRLLPQASALFATIMSGSGSTMDFNDDAF